jgi:hypothetical protein
MNKAAPKIQNFNTRAFAMHFILYAALFPCRGKIICSRMMARK